MGRSFYSPCIIQRIGESIIFENTLSRHPSGEVMQNDNKSEQHFWAITSV